MSDSKTSSGSVGFTGLLTIAFVVLKLCKMIDWSWGWVISPIWISIALVLLILCFMGLYYLLKSYQVNKRCDALRKKREAELKELRDRANQVHDSISEGKWQQRMNEMHNKKGAVR
jgi:uncharacterized membrane protein